MPKDEESTRCHGCETITGTQPNRPPADGEVWLCFGCQMTAELHAMAEEGDKGAQEALYGWR